MLQEDWIGMRTLHEAGKLEFQDCPGDHMHFNLEVVGALQLAHECMCGGTPQPEAMRLL